MAKKTAGLFFAAIDDVLTGKKVLDQAPAAPRATSEPATAEAAVGAAPGLVTAARGLQPAPASPTAITGRRLDLLAAAAFGAVSMAIGALIGARAGRGGR